MKATELMLNNWVLENTFYHRPMQIEIVEPNRVWLKGAKEYSALTEIEPIPLTPEILEKNGIELLEVGDNGMATPSIHKNRYEKWFVHTQWRDTYLWFDRQTKEYHLHNMNGAMFTCVHELQHALRLCGIDKEITL